MCQRQSNHRTGALQRRRRWKPSRRLERPTRVKHLAKGATAHARSHLIFLGNLSPFGMPMKFAIVDGVRKLHPERVAPALTAANQRLPSAESTLCGIGPVNHVLTAIAGGSRKLNGTEAGRTAFRTVGRRLYCLIRIRANDMSRMFKPRVDW